MTVQRGVKVSVPKALTGAVSQEDCLSITINGENEIFLNKEKTEIEELPGLIIGIRKSEPDRKVFINGDEKAGLGVAIEILDLLRVNGIDEVNFVTKKK